MCEVQCVCVVSTFWILLVCRISFLNLKLKSGLPTTYFTVAPSFCNFAQSTVVIKFQNDLTIEMDVIEVYVL